MADPDSTPDSQIASESSSGVSQVLREVAHVPRVVGALQAVALPTPLRGIEPNPEAPQQAVPPVGSVVAERYRLDAVLGTGGMGVVFAASHLQTEKQVALKWLLLSRRERGAGDHARALARFAREARVAGRIRHPNVVDVYDASGDERTPFLVMERLEGETLRARIERAPLTWDEMMTLLMPALRGVAELHRQGIVHRDLKPDNVFLAQLSGGALCAKVLDFGVSRLRSHDSVEDSLTRTGAIVGTPSYMPLEQLRGDDGVDARTDVYALGVVLFESLTGKRPWQARTAAEYGALLATERPTRLSVLVPALKGPREAALMKALERRPQDRHPDVAAFMHALEQASRAPARRTRLLLLVTSVVVLVAVAALWLAADGRGPVPASQSHPAAAARPERTPAAGPVRVRGAPIAAQPLAEDAPAAPARQEPLTDPGSHEAPPAMTSPSARRSPGRRPQPAVDAASIRPEQAWDSLQPRAIEPRVEPSRPADRATNLARDQF